MRLKNSSKRGWESLQTKLVLVGAVVLLALALFAYYTLSSSYTVSKEAKRLYEAGSYQQALELALGVQQSHLYNIMAFSVVEQSRLALRWEGFNAMAREYHLETQRILAQKKIVVADLTKIRLMAELVLHEHGKLGDPGPFLPKEMILEADKHYEQFAALYTQITGDPLPKVSRPSGIFPWSRQRDR